MIEEVSSIFWGLSLAINIILLLVGLPLCLLICCCCRKHQGALERDVASFIQNHNLGGGQIQQTQPPQLTYQMQPSVQPIMQPGMFPNQQGVQGNQGGLENQEVQQKVHGSQNLSSGSRDLDQNLENSEVRKRNYAQHAFDNDELME